MPMPSRMSGGTNAQPQMRHSVALDVFVYWVAMYMPCSAAFLSTVTPG